MNNRTLELYYTFRDYLVLALYFVDEETDLRCR